MYVDSNTVVGKDGTSYTRHLLRESYREGKKVKHRTIANLSHCRVEEIEAIRLALRHKKDLHKLGPMRDGMSVEQGPSFGAVFTVYQVADELGIAKALGTSRQGKLALWQVIARVIGQGSRLSAVRLASSHAALELLNLSKFDEDDLYENLEWICDEQKRIEDVLFSERHAQSASTVYLYDVTSSYLEGTQNAFAQFGYNRDGKRGKRQIVIGLLCDADGNPLSIEVFPGNTQDPSTVASQIDKLKKRFHVESVALVGDRGMIKSQQIEKLLAERMLQLSLFDDELAEVSTNEGVRYVLRRNPARAHELVRGRESKLQNLRSVLQTENKYLSAHPRASTDKALDRIIAKVEKLRLASWISVECFERALRLTIDDEARAEDSKLDGCYVLKTDLSPELASKEIVHARYKDLAYVERAFRTSKTTHLEMRPIFLQRENRTRAHALVVMLAYQIIRELTSRWKELNLTVEEGLSRLSSFCLMRVSASNTPLCYQLPLPRPDVALLLRAAKLTLPKTISAASASVSTRKILQKERNRKRSQCVTPRKT